MAVTASLSCSRLPLSPTTQHFPSHSLSLSSSFTLNPLQTRLQLRLQPFCSAKSTLPIIQMSMEGQHGRHGHQTRHDEQLPTGGEGGAGNCSGVLGRQHRDAGEDQGHRRLQCGADGVQEGEGP